MSKRWNFSMEGIQPILEHATESKLWDMYGTGNIPGPNVVVHFNDHCCLLSSNGIPQQMTKGRLLVVAPSNHEGGAGVGLVKGPFTIAIFPVSMFSIEAVKKTGFFDVVVDREHCYVTGRKTELAEMEGWELCEKAEYAMEVLHAIIEEMRSRDLEIFGDMPEDSSEWKLLHEFHVPLTEVDETQAPRSNTIIGVLNRDAQRIELRGYYIPPELQPEPTVYNPSKAPKGDASEN